MKGVLSNDDVLLRLSETNKTLLAGEIDYSSAEFFIERAEKERDEIADKIELMLRGLMQLNVKHNLASSIVSESSRLFSQYLWDTYEERRRRSNYVISKIEIRLMVFGRDGFKCRLCPSRESLTVDHIIPVVKGGKDDFENLQTLCKSCNSSKGGR